MKIILKIIKKMFHFGEENKLKTIGILSFFSVLNKNREEYKETLKILKMKNLILSLIGIYLMT